MAGAASYASGAPAATFQFVDATHSGTVTVAAGTYALPAASRFQCLGEQDGNFVLNLAADVDFTGLSELTIEDCNVQVNNTSAANISLSSGKTLTVQLLGYANNQLLDEGTKPFVAAAGATLNFAANGLGYTSGGGGFTAFASLDATSTFNAYLYDFSFLDVGSLSITTGAVVAINVYGVGTFVDDSLAQYLSLKPGIVYPAFFTTPNANVVGSVGALYAVKSSLGSGGQLWLKTEGDGTNSHWTQISPSRAAATVSTSGTTAVLNYAMTTTTSASVLTIQTVCKVTVAGSGTTLGDTFTQTLLGSFKNTGGTVSVVGAGTVVATASDTSLDTSTVSLSGSGTNAVVTLTVNASSGTLGTTSCEISATPLTL
jgi:hypothetical protein